MDFFTGIFEKVGSAIRSVFSFLGTFTVSKILPAVVIAAVGFLILSLLLKAITNLLNKSKLEKAAHSLILSVLKVVGYVLLALIIASKLGIDVTGIVALASVLTLAVSLALQNLLSNVIGGFTLLYTKPFASGDFVEIAGQSGTIMEIGLSYTKLSTADNKLVSLPNSAVVAAQIVNYTTNGSRRVDINVSAAYTMPVEKVLEALREAGNVPTALPEVAPFAAVSKYGESAIEYVLQVWCGADDYWATLFNTNQNIKAVFDAKGIEMTYPHLNVHLGK